jgi:manganese efflux pump family protein
MAASASKSLRKFDAIKMTTSFAIFHVLMLSLGWYGGLGLKSVISGVDHWIAFLLLGLVGGKIIYEAVKGKHETIPSMSLAAILVLSLATSIDALVIGVSFAFLEFEPVTSILFLGFTVFLASWLGIFLGKKLGHVFSKKANIIGGVILIFLGVKILIEHLFL